MLKRIGMLRMDHPTSIAHMDGNRGRLAGSQSR